ncbi:unnamed protein product [Clonostachys chloroleuca]|uniref:Uncharacterized protein n=1 Tax=Clonostachys chloroleuca TaxID=1926264 RepID=A0AA35M4Q9_9HYPO|nr:unnamed protein product [Clonostachys chloroleuca]
MPSIFKKAMAAGAVFSAAASAQNFRVVGQLYTGTPGETITYRTWYGDGNLYVGPKVPASVSNALNFTIPDWTGTQPQVLVGPVPPATSEDLPDGTFIAINNATGATDPVLLTNDESSLGDGYISKWLRYGTFMVPANPSGTSDTHTFFYLANTEEPGTFQITWRTPGTAEEGLQRINITAVL